MPDAPVTDDALVEEIARVIWDGDPAHYSRHWQEHSQEQARRALAHLRERGMLAEWRTIDSAPTDGTWVLAFWPDEPVQIQLAEGCLHYKTGKPFWFNGYDDNAGASQPTHWMPRPAAPTGETE